MLSKLFGFGGACSYQFLMCLKALVHSRRREGEIRKTIIIVIS